MSDLVGLLSPEQANQIQNLIVSKPQELQQKIFHNLISSAKDTVFGQDHDFKSIQSYTDFKSRVPIREYSDFDKYWELIAKHSLNILWPGKPLFQATTSASTGFPKLIPVTKESLESFLLMPIRALMQYVYNCNDYSLLEHDFLFLTGTTNTRLINNYPSGSISGICRQMFPQQLSINSLPSREILDLMESKGWDVMFEEMVNEVSQRSVSLCTGLPSWILQYLLAACKVHKTKNLTSIMPDLKLICTSGVSNKPYIEQIQRMFDHKIDFIEFYSASEGAFAYQDSLYDSSMLLNLSDNIFFEFVKLNNIELNNPPRVMITEVELETAYVPIISTTAGLWAYKMGDVIKFTSTKPYRVEFIGRTKHFISIANESVYAKNVEDAISEVSKELNFSVTNFTVAPYDIKKQTQPYYSWYIEAERISDINIHQLAFKLDYYLKYYSDSYARARNQAALTKPRVNLIKPGGFLKLLQLKDKTSLQLKVPKLQNDREIVDFLEAHNLVVEPETVLE